MCVPASLEPDRKSPEESLPQILIPLRLAESTPLRIALDQRVRLQHEGEKVHGKLVETAYAFDQAVIPAGSEAEGRVTQIDPVSAGHRALAYANGDFSPFHKYQVTFDSVRLPDGRVIAIQTTVSAGTEMVRLVSHPQKEQEREKSAAARAIDKAKKEASDTAHEAIDEVRSPGRLERLKQFLLARLPYRRQYIEPGTRFNASLERPLDFGTTTRTKEELALLGTAPPPDSLAHARLLLEVSSATSSRGAPVVALLTEPVFSADHKLVLPAESRIIGQVIQAKPARNLHRNGSLRLVFEHIETPEGRLRPAQASLEGVEVEKAERMRLDEEGGAHTTDSKTRYLSTGLAILMAAAASHPDVERGAPDPGGDPAIRAGAGGSGFGFAGALISLAAKSTPVSIAFGAYGAGSSVYANFLSRGHDVVFPKDTSLEVSFGSPHPTESGRKGKS
jgi:hypothetical protein